MKYKVKRGKSISKSIIPPLKSLFQVVPLVAPREVGQDWLVGHLEVPCLDLGAGHHRGDGGAGGTGDEVAQQAEPGKRTRKIYLNLSLNFVPEIDVCRRCFFLKKRNYLCETKTPQRKNFGNSLYLQIREKAIVVGGAVLDVLGLYYSS